MLAALPELGMAPADVGFVMLLLYVLVLAVPFVPGAEIGLALIIVYGTVMALPVYIATVLALSIAFAVGRCASQNRHSRSKWGSYPTSDAMALFADRLRDRPWLQRVLRFRWLAVIALINMPGNTVIGGGGGIAMAIGYSRTFTFPAFLVCVAAAVAPVPAMVLCADVIGFAERLDVWLGKLV